MTGAHFEISFDGKPRMHRDKKEGADQAAAFLKKQHPNGGVVVRDLRANLVKMQWPREIKG